MSFIRCRFFSPLLRQHTSLHAAFPGSLIGRQSSFPLLYLLHGGTEDSTIWFREANVEALADKYGLFIVSIDAMSSSYADMRHGLPYFTFLTEELPAFLCRRFQLKDRSKRIIIQKLEIFCLDLRCFFCLKNLIVFYPVIEFIAGIRPCPYGDQL